jgi:hypothetical protein
MNPQRHFTASPRVPPRALASLVAACVAMFVSALALGASRHPAVSAVAMVQVREGGGLSIAIVHDTLAYVLNDTSSRVSDAQMLALLDSPEPTLDAALTDARSRFEHSFTLEADGKPLPYIVKEAPDLPGIKQWLIENPGRPLPCKLEYYLEGQLPLTCRSLRLKLPAVMGDMVVNFDHIGREPVFVPAPAGEWSPAFDISLGAAQPSQEQAEEQSQPPHASSTDAISVAWRFVRLGFVHIIPEGPDHCLFVLGLFLLSPRLKPLLLQISSFTLAHTLTLTLTSLGIIGLKSSIVEPAIALSVAFIGIENLVTKRVHAWRPIVAFLFGLVHGMGVATSFNEAGFPAGQLVTSLAAFTVGVEGGHLAVLASAFLLLGWTSNKPWQRSRVCVPLSMAISLVALMWLTQRLGLSPF